MARALINISKYALIFLILVFTCLSFAANTGVKEKKHNKKYIVQNILTMCIFTICMIIILYNKWSVESLVFFVLEYVYLFVLVALNRVIYPDCSVVLLNNMTMLLAMGFIMVERLAPQSAFKQFLIVLVATGISFVIPRIMRKRRLLIKLKYPFAFLGIALLMVTLVIGKTSYGANISFTIAGISFQPSEFVKLIYVLFVAAMLSKAKNFKNIMISASLAAIHVLILVASTDLGAALIFFIVYIVMLYVGSGKIRYLLAGLLAGSTAAILAYRLFNHVRTRVLAWRDPWSIIEKGGYQITQSLFAIGTGGLFGMGLYQGFPNKIPVAVKDFVFAAIAEEFGMIYAICIILICFSSFISIMSIASKCRDLFYKLVAVGFGTLYIFQCFLTIGGVTKFIPSTGVTLPFVSYGGSSILCSLVMFAMIQAVFILVKENEEDEEIEKEKELSEP